MRPPSAESDRAPDLGPIPLMGARARLAAVWDDVEGDFIDGRSSSLPEELASWFASYKPRADDPIVADALPEPYLGHLDRRPAGVCLALNPGQAHVGHNGKRDFQSKAGVFAHEIRDDFHRSYRSWASSWPYLRPPWTDDMGSNRHHCARLRFLRRWYDDPALSADKMLAFELYPWHTTKVTAPIKPDPSIIRDFVWQPIVELGNPPVFAFGADWFRTLKALGLTMEIQLGAGGEPYGSEVPGRTVAVFQDKSGIRVIAEKHSGSATPPSATEVTKLRSALIKRNLI